MRNVSQPHSSSLPNGPSWGVDTANRPRKPNAGGQSHPAALPVSASPSQEKRTVILPPVGSGGRNDRIRHFGRQGRVYYVAMTLFGPPFGRWPMTVPPPVVLLISSETLALGHAVPAAIRSASPKLCLAAVSMPLSSAPLSWAITDTVATSAPVAPGGLELA